MNTHSFDLVVLGAGSGGIATAVRAARHGARVVVLEPGALGGTCVNVGCVPKKAMWLAAELAEAQQLAHEVGFSVAPAALDWSEFVSRRQRYIGGIHASYRQRFAELGIELVAARGHFVAPNRVAAGEDEFVAPHVLVATGARPVRPYVPGAELGIDSNGFFDLRAVPRRVAIVGGGYIAVEFAGVLQALGAEAHVFVRGPRLLRDFDAETIQVLSEAMRARGVRLHLRRGLEAVRRESDGYALALDGEEVIGGFDELIWATGRAANSGGIGLAEIGVELDADGHVVVDDWQDTKVAGVHAVGDVTGRLDLTPVAIAAGRKLADRLFGGKPEARLDYDNVPTVVFAHPPLATVGLGEDEARRRHGDTVRIYRVRFRPMLSALAGREHKTFMKLVCAGEDQRVVGIHLAGPGADEMLQGFAVALKAGARKADFDATMAIHPTAAEELVLMSEPGEAFVGAAD
ncbi:glutathione-disulfide reductase [Dokdonella sp.]|uniref:glutathione-disulfide reductase n=1 Tax=Dokdonella sp. TaxID=2291710 RepID=UPI0025C2DBD8|nr:glutathione-disulfide reductase [Dokdonella sp.]